MAQLREHEAIRSKLSLTFLALLALASPVFAAEPIIVDGCSVVETYDAHDTVDGDVRHSTTVVCYGDDHAPAVRKSQFGISSSGGGIMLTPGTTYCCYTHGACAPCR